MPKKGWQKIGLVGAGDLADIAHLVAQGANVQVSLVSEDADLRSYDAILITDVANPQGAYDSIRDKVAPNRLLTLYLLHISRSSFSEGELK